MIDTNQTETIPTIQQIPMQAFFTGRMELPPGINASYKRVSFKRDGEIIHTLGESESLHQFKRDAALQLSQGYHDWSLINAIRQSKRKVPLRMTITFYFKSLWKRDIDGGIKAVQDAVFSRLELNDTLIVKLNVEKYEDPEAPRAEVEVYCDLSTTSSH
jgi:Holliday junction resolvase RusA-like endonuclease